MINRKALTIFLVLAFLISWPLFLIPLAFKNAEAQTLQLITTGAYSLAMWGPGIAAIVATLSSGKSFSDLNLGRLGPKRPYLWAWLLFPILSVATGLITLLLGIGKFDPDLTLMNQSLAMLPDAETLSPAIIIAAQVGAAITLAPLVNMLFALGEELGWRGFLLPTLLPLGQWKAIIISNVIWGLWHAPAIAQGHNYPGYPVAGVFMMVVFTILLGTILSWLYLKTKSPWAPALAHGSINAVAGLPLLFLIPGFDMAIGGTLASVAGWIPLGAFVLWLVLTRRVPVSDDDDVLETEES